MKNVKKDFKAILRNLLNLADLDLRRRRKTVQALMCHPRLATAGTIVEVIGTQGVGKSTLTSDLHRSLKDDWFFRCDLGEVGPPPTPLENIERLHRDIYFRKVHHVEQTVVDPWRSITVSRAMAHVISESLTLLSNDFPRGFFIDEGLFKNLPRQVLELASDHPEPLWLNRAFVYLCARDPELVIQRYRVRVAERNGRGALQRAPSDAEVRDRILHDNDLFDRLLEKAQAFECPTLIVDAEDSHEKNINRILEFERTLRIPTRQAPSACLQRT